MLSIRVMVLDGCGIDDGVICVMRIMAKIKTKSIRKPSTERCTYDRNEDDVDTNSIEETLDV